MLILPNSLFTKSNKVNDVEINLLDKPEQDHENKASFKKTLKLLPIFMKNKVLVFSVLGLANLCFVITVIQFWGSDYMEFALNIDKDSVFTSFMIVCLTAPTIGVLIGGGITGYIGGYEKLGTSYLCSIAALLATLLSLPIPFCKGLFSYTGVLYAILVFGGMIFPSILGMLLYIYFFRYNIIIGTL